VYRRVPAILALLIAACSPSAAGVGAGPTAATTPPTTSTSTTPPPPSTTTPATTTTTDPFARPAWLGTRLLPLRPDEFGEVQPTPPELQNRRFTTLDLLPPPAGGAFASTIGPVPPEVAARSSWTEECPVALADLAYLTVSHYGFDERLHTGEMIVHASVAEDVVGVFERLHAARFPIEQMRVIRAEEVDAHPTGDWNDTTSFVCRPAVGAGSWSMHAFGLAIDINPFHNPYLKGDLVLPELASFYLDRELGQPGMITDGDVAVKAFAEIGWPWGGNWSSLKDWMHFSQNGT
jgi:hypothetical protein